MDRARVSNAKILFHIGITGISGVRIFVTRDTGNSTISGYTGISGFFFTLKRYERYTIGNPRQSQGLKKLNVEDGKIK